MANIGSSDAQIIAQHRTGFYVLGALLIIAGLVNVAFPFVGTLTVEAWIAAGFLIAGVAQIVQSVRAQDWPGFFMGLLIGILYVAAGFILIANPFGGAITLTVLLAVVLMIGGILELVLGFQMRPLQGWGLVVVSGLLGLILGGLIWLRLPSSAVWVLGLMLGLNLISSGFAMIGLASAAGKNADGTSSKA